MENLEKEGASIMPFLTIACPTERYHSKLWSTEVNKLATII
jgi:hypothetical protein